MAAGHSANRTWDMKGPEDQPLRFAVAVKDVLTFRDRMKRAKGKTAGRTTKKPTEKDIQKLDNEVMSKIEADDMPDIARNMVSTGSGFDRENSFMSSWSYT